MIANVDEIYAYALKLLRARDHTVASFRKRVEIKFGQVPSDLVDQLTRKNFLNDRRFAENYVAKRKDRGRTALREELLTRGVSAALADEILSQTDWPSLRDALKAKMVDWKLRTPLQSKDAARLFRALLRLGYDEDAIREEVESLRER